MAVDFGPWVGDGSNSTLVPKVGGIAQWRKISQLVGRPAGKGLSFRDRGAFEGFDGTPGQTSGPNKFESIIKYPISDAIEVVTAGGAYSTNMNPRLGQSSGGQSKTPIPWGDIGRGQWDAAIRQNIRDCITVKTAVPAARILVEFLSEINVPNSGPGSPAQPRVPDGPTAIPVVQGIANYLSAVRRVLLLESQEVSVRGPSGIIWVTSMGRQTSNWDLQNSPYEWYIVASLQDTAGAFPAIFGVDGYCRTNGNSNQNFSPSTLWDTCRSRAEANGKKWGIFETAHHAGFSDAEGNDKGAHYTDEAVYIELHKAGVSCVFHNVDEGLYDPGYFRVPPDNRNGWGSPSALAWIAAANQPVYVSGGGGNPSASGPVVISGGGQLHASGIQQSGPTPGYPDQRQLPRKRLTLRSE